MQSGSSEDKIVSLEDIAYESVLKYCLDKDNVNEVSGTDFISLYLESIRVCERLVGIVFDSIDDLFDKFDSDVYGMFRVPIIRLFNSTNLDKSEYGDFIKAVMRVTGKLGDAVSTRGNLFVIDKDKLKELYLNRYYSNSTSEG